MAGSQRQDDSLYKEFKDEDNKDIIDTIDEYEMMELEVETGVKKTKDRTISESDAKCDGTDCLLGVKRQLALFLCYVCDIYLCEECFRDHEKTHEFVRVDSEKSERKRMAEMFVGRLRGERTREFYLNVENSKVYGRVNVKHELDKKDCEIYGIHGIRDKRWVVLDSANNCLKIFSSVTNTLLRYVRFGSEPRGVTEIKQKSPDLDSASSRISDVSVTARDQPDKQCLLAVTFPRIKQIWLIDVQKTPAIKTNIISMQKDCYSIDFSEDTILIHCIQGVGSGSRQSVDILSTEGVRLKVIQLDIPRFFPYPDLAVYKGNCYLTNYHNNKVICINIEEGKTISQVNADGWGVRGISVDTSNNVYVSALKNNQVYKLSPDLRRYKPIGLGKEYTGESWGEYTRESWSEYTREPWSICFFDGKLFIGHFPSSSLRNFVTVFQLT